MPNLEDQHQEIEAELETELELLNEEYDKGNLTEAEYKKAQSKLQFNLKQLQAKHEQQRAQEMGLNEKMERKRDWFND